MPTHKRDEGHEVQGSAVPDGGTYLTEAVAVGDAGPCKFFLGKIVGNQQGDLLLTVEFTDGEIVQERLKMGDMLSQWISEIHHSKRMRDEFGA